MIPIGDSCVENIWCAAARMRVSCVTGFVEIGTFSSDS